jgi:hypothetical protein
MILMTLALAALLALSSANAVELEEYDFDGNFKMDVPAGYEFANENSFFGIDIGATKVYQDREDNINVSFAGYINDEQCFNDMIKTIKEEPNVNLAQKQDFYLIKTEKFNIVLFKKDHKIVAISSADLDFKTLMKMADSVKIT